jgi:hypothetical protein
MDYYEVPRGERALQVSGFCNQLIALSPANSPAASDGNGIFRPKIYFPATIEERTIDTAACVTSQRWGATSMALSQQAQSAGAGRAQGQCRLHAGGLSSPNWHVTIELKALTENSTS